MFRTAPGTASAAPVSTDRARGPTQTQSVERDQLDKSDPSFEAAIVESLKDVLESPSTPDDLPDLPPDEVKRCGPLLTLSLTSVVEGTRR